MDLPSLFPLLLILLVGYLLLVRPARTRQRQMAELQQQLRPGVEIVTTAGLYATVVSLDEGTVTLESSPGVSARYDRRAVARVLTAVPSAAEQKPADGIPPV